LRKRWQSRQSSTGRVSARTTDKVGPPAAC